MTREKLKDLEMYGTELRTLDSMISDIEKYLNKEDCCKEICFYNDSSFYPPSLRIGLTDNERKMVNKLLQTSIKDFLAISLNRLKEEKAVAEEFIDKA